MVRLSIVWITLLAIGVAASTLRGTTLLPAEFREIVTKSQIIAYGRVVEVVPELSDDRKRIETIVTFEVGTYLKGGRGESLTFRVPGGQIGRYRSVMIGAPLFQEGDEAVLFLTQREDGMPRIFGLNQGVFRVQREERSQRRIVFTPLLARGESPELVVRGSAGRQPMTLEAFGAQVTSLLAELATNPR